MAKSIKQVAKHLAIFNDTLGDIDINGFVTMTDKELEDFEDLASSITWGFVYPINGEELEYLDGEEFLSKIDFIEISNDEYKILNKIFEHGFGTFINEDYLEDIVYVENDENYEKDEELDEQDEN
jgi:hypothetical protein